MAFDAIAAVSGMSGVSPLGTVQQLGSGVEPTGASGSDFSSLLSGAVQNLSAMQKSADTLAVKAVTGDLTDIHQATLAATRAQVTMELVSAVRNKGVDAFNEIMRMQA